MRMSCNGCRVLRKGCSDNCSIRPCLQWIKSPDSQANATVFLAKFYGRAGLMNLINAGPDHLRAAIFRSLLYEACGRIVNPIYGSAGLLWSGSWHLCQAAVENVLKGSPINPINSDTEGNNHAPPFKAYDIRHVSKEENSEVSNSGSGPSGSRVKSRNRGKRVSKPKPTKPVPVELTRSTSHESSMSHQSELAVVDGESKETESMVSVETAEPSLLFGTEPDASAAVEKDNEPKEVGHGLGLDLTLGLAPFESRVCHVMPVKKRRVEGFTPYDADTCKMELGINCQVESQNGAVLRFG